MTAGFSVANVLNKWLDVIRGGGSNFTAPASVFIQLHTGDPGANGTANISAGSSTRVAATQTAPAAGQMTINGTLPQWTNGGTSETITHISAWTLAAGGSFQYSGALAVSKAWANGDTLTLNQLTVSVSPAAA